MLLLLLILLQTPIVFAEHPKTNTKDYNLSDEILESYNSIKKAKLKSQTIPNLLIFISFSMPDTLILQYIEEAKKNNNNGILVLQGFLKDNQTGKYSIPKTTSKILQITNNKGAGIMINPTLFEMFEIKQVPTIIRTRGTTECITNASLCKSTPLFDKIQGSVSISYALELFDTEGDTGRALQSNGRSTGDNGADDSNNTKFRQNN